MTHRPSSRSPASGPASRASRPTTSRQTGKEYTSDQEVRWCPGCGDYAVLKAVQGFLPELGPAPGEHRLRLRHRLLVAVPLLPRHLRHALDPRPGAGDRDRHRHRPRGPLGLGGHRRRRRALDRRQPPDPRAAPQREHDDPAVQQPDLRAHQGPVLPHLRARQGHQVHADGLGRPPVQPGLAGARRRGHLRGPHHRLRPQAPHRGALGGGRAPRHVVRRDLPELPDLQRRRVRRDQGPRHQGRRDHPARARRADPLRGRVGLGKAPRA